MEKQPRNSLTREQKKRAKCLVRQGSEFLKHNQAEQALESFREARGLVQNNHLIYFLIGKTLWMMKRIEEAIASLCHAQELYEFKEWRKQNPCCADGTATPEEDDDIRDEDEEVETPLDPQISYYLARCWKDSGEAKKGAQLLKKTAETLFGDAVYGSAELEIEPAKSYSAAESFIAAAMHDEAFDQLEPLIREKLVSLDKLKNGIESR